MCLHVLFSWQAEELMRKIEKEEVIKFKFSLLKLSYLHCV